MAHTTRTIRYYDISIDLGTETVSSNALNFSDALRYLAATIDMHTLDNRAMLTSAAVYGKYSGNTDAGSTVTITAY